MIAAYADGRQLKSGILIGYWDEAELAAARAQGATERTADGDRRCRVQLAHASSSWLNFQIWIASKAELPQYVVGIVMSPQRCKSSLLEGQTDRSAEAPVLPDRGFSAPAARRCALDETAAARTATFHRG